MIEFIGVTTSETRTLVRSCQLLRKFLSNYLLLWGALIAIMAIIPWSYLNSSDSPFVTVFELAGIKWAAALISFVVLTSAASALNSTLYSETLISDCLDSLNRFLKAIKVDTAFSPQCTSKAVLWLP